MFLAHKKNIPQKNIYDDQYNYLFYDYYSIINIIQKKELNK